MNLERLLAAIARIVSERHGTQIEVRKKDESERVHGGNAK